MGQKVNELVIDDEKTDIGLEALYRELNKTKEELEKANVSLEKKVQERAKELEKLNRALKRDITKRRHTEKELQHTLEMLREAMRGTIQAVALTVETRDPCTAGHQQRVSDLARAIATEMGLSKDRVDEIRMVGLVHDIGKVGLPAEILSKPTHLSDAEFDFIKTHPLMGCKIMKKVRFPWSVDKIILQHHERMDGSGYPSGLKGKEIVIEARILGVADVVEAMSSHRPYRPACGIEKALEEITKNKGILYDPKVVDVCLKLFREKKFEFRLKERKKML